MSAPKPAAAIDHDPAIAAIENAPLDPNALTADEAEALDAQIAASRDRAARGERLPRTSAEVTTEISKRAKREG